MTKAILYLRSATGSREQTDRQEDTYREYLQERGLFDAGTFTESGQPHDRLTDLIDTATKAGITEVVVADLSRLGSRPQASMRNLNALKGAGLTLHAATGTLSGPSWRSAS
ncbi:hypothetical protein N864_10940 [Intrasporangium chromatireducens Q5-1]|uniref:Resolvase/invertase-type recombinase catalytic domain-containing protein n=1 Tax=Intrasporangium chromatireducens Q5-1 TaxID=584657 RepID=W9GM46_9MICO|nr:MULTISPECIES: recombinase family protein [Actinomycetes]EWT07160.1 hypothetical protein N864_10940 [Intrasporangium chromatireducens Q5-1]